MYIATAIRLKVILICSFNVHVNGNRILAVFPTPSISHQVVFRPLTQELAKRGHEVLVITPDPAFEKGKIPKNLQEIDAHDYSYKRWTSAILTGTTTSGKSDDMLSQMNMILKTLSDIFEMQMLSEEVQHVIKNRSEDFDLLLIEACIRPAISLSHVFKVPVIFVSSFAGFARNYDLIGAPSRPPLLYPNFLRQKVFNLTLWEKIVELYTHYSLESLYVIMEERDNKIIKRLFGPDIPTITELENNVHMLFLNNHPLWDQNRPVPPSVIYMGGVHQNPSNELPENMKSYLDSSKHGVIYISFGTNVSPSSLPPERIQVLVRVFSQLPHDVLWKWDRDELPGRTHNIRIAKWLPQSDLLKHPKVKLFITQGGLQSTDEAITAGVPLIGIPMLGDQWYNVEQYVHHRIGLRLDMDLLTEEKLMNGIQTILNDDSYRKSILRLRSIMRDQPQRPLERAVWWAEHVLRHGGAPHLRAPVANMSWAQYLDLELITAMALAMILAILAVCVILHFLITAVRNILSRNSVVKLKES